MIPVGNHIEITEPQQINKRELLAEKENISIAHVIQISPDLSPPFKCHNTVFFHTNKQKYLKGKIFITYDLIVGYDDNSK